MDNLNLPLVSIGLPVYNGERYLRQAIESLLAQDYGNFELIISDNASTDSTFTICQEYQAKDKRIRLYKNDRNLWMAYNFNNVFHLSSGKYFMWAAHDDLWGSTFISKCVARLEQNPAAIMCETDAQHIDQFGNKGYTQIVAETLGMDVSQRLHKLMTELGGFNAYALMRSEALRKTNLLQPKFGLDIILLMELTMLGELVKVPEILFYYRFIPKTLDHYMSDINPSAKPVKAGFTGVFREMMQIILKSDLHDSVKYKLQNEFIEYLMLENLPWRQFIIGENRPGVSTIDAANLRNIINRLIIR